MGYLWADTQGQTQKVLFCNNADSAGRAAPLHVAPHVAPHVRCGDPKNTVVSQR